MAMVPRLDGAQLSFQSHRVGGEGANISVVRKNTSSVGRGRKNSSTQIGGETRQIGGWQMGGSLQPSSPRRRVQKQKMWEVEEKEKRRGIKRWREFKDGQQMDSGDARRAPSTRN